MDTREMQEEFGIQMNQLNEPLALSSKDIFYWLNKAQEHFVITRYNGMNLTGRGFEQSQQVIDDLKTLVKKNHYISCFYDDSFSFMDFKADYAEFPANMMFLLSDRSRIAYHFPFISFTYDGSPSGSGANPRSPQQPYIEIVVKNRYSQSDDIFKMLEDPFNTTKVLSPLCDISDRGITVYTDSTFVVNNVIINYIRRPKRLTLVSHSAEETDTCELPPHTHKEIIQLAVDLFLQNTRELKQRLQRETPTADKQQNIEDNE